MPRARRRGSPRLCLCFLGLPDAHVGKCIPVGRGVFLPPWADEPVCFIADGG